MMTPTGKYKLVSGIRSLVRRKKEQAVSLYIGSVSRVRVMISRTAMALYDLLTPVVMKLSSAIRTGSLYYRHTLPVRVMHWVNVLFLLLLLMSGFNIFNAHPALYWSKQSYDGSPPVFELKGGENREGEIVGVTAIFGRKFITTGFFGASAEASGELTVRGFPSWLTLPKWQWLSMARRWHFFIAWLFALNGIVFVSYSIVTGHLHHDLLPTGHDFLKIGKTIKDHLLFRHPTGETAKHYNILQKTAYLGVIFFLLPMMILMGLGMSPALDALHAGWVDIFGGRQSIRTIHFILAWVLVLFVAVHVFMVTVTGLWNNLRSMITGYYKIKPETPDER